MKRTPSTAQLVAAMQAHDEVIGLEPRPNLRMKHAAMLAALRAAADFTTPTPGARNEQLQRDPARR